MYRPQIFTASLKTEFVLLYIHLDELERYTSPSYPSVDKPSNDLGFRDSLA